MDLERLERLMPRRVRQRRSNPPRTVRKKSRKHNTRQSCNGKVRFRDKPEADRALHIISNVNTRSKIPGRSYRCDRCGGWHLTSMPQHPMQE